MRYEPTASQLDLTDFETIIARESVEVSSRTVDAELPLPRVEDRSSGWTIGNFLSYLVVLVLAWILM